MRQLLLDYLFLVAVKIIEYYIDNGIDEDYECCMISGDTTKFGVLRKESSEFMKIVITGAKGTGKSTSGLLLGKELGLESFETDEILETLYFKEKSIRRTCRDILSVEGEESFREWEKRAVAQCEAMNYCIVITGGGTLKDPENRRILRKNAILVYLKGDPDLLWSRIQPHGIPSFLSGKDAFTEFSARVALLEDIVLPYSDIVVEIEPSVSPGDVALRIRDRIEQEILLSASRFSTSGTSIQLHTFGESHGPAIGAVLDGIPAGISLSVKDIQKEMNRRRPGQSSISTARFEADQVRILSGIFEGKTTGSPIALLVENTQQRSGDYESLREIFRPGHADFTFWKKYGVRDHRGGGRSSGRETAARVMGGAIAKQILADKGIEICAFTIEINGIRAGKIDYEYIESNPVRCPDPQAAKAMEAAIVAARNSGDSIGGIVQLEIRGVPAGLGDPVFAKLDARLGGALFSIGAVKGVEFGAGFESARMRGSENNDQMEDGMFKSNNSGGILGGISTGEMITARIAIKPTPSVGTIQKTIDTEGVNKEIQIKGRHDPCIVPRAIPVVEAMAALVLLDCMLIQENLLAVKNLRTRDSC